MECYFEFCLSEEVGNVGSFLAYIGEAGPLLLGCSGAVGLVGLWVGGLCGLIRKALLCRML